MPFRCSVVLCTYNRVEYLKKSIPALLSLDFVEYEIIVVNDGSTDATGAYLKELEAHSRVRVFTNQKNIGLSLSRNIGIQQAKHDIIAFTDDDCLVSINWLTQLMSGFTDDQVGFVIGQVYYRNIDYKGYFPERLVQNIGARWPMGANIAYRKLVFERVGDFEDIFFRMGNEDSEMAIRAVSFGINFARVPTAIVFHQAMNWTARSLLRSARNFSVWPNLKKMYPNHYLVFGPKITFGCMVDAKDYLYFLILPLFIPVLLARYLYHGKRDIKIFFTKWPLYILLKRYYIYREAVRQKIFMI